MTVEARLREAFSIIDQAQAEREILQKVAQAWGLGDVAEVSYLLDMGFGSRLRPIEWPPAPRPHFEGLGSFKTVRFNCLHCGGPNSVQVEGR